MENVSEDYSPSSSPSSSSSSNDGKHSNLSMISPMEATMDHPLLHVEKSQEDEPESTSLEENKTPSTPNPTTELKSPSSQKGENHSINSSLPKGKIEPSMAKEGIWSDDGKVRSRILNAPIPNSTSRITGATLTNPPPFANLTHCENCRVDVGYLMSASRHHCRNCGGTFCDSCSSNWTIVPYEEFTNRGEQRVCAGCYQKIREFQLQTNSTTVTWNGILPQTDKEFQDLFDLESNEIPVIIFSCAYFPAHVPYYGHMYLTNNYLCFESYRGKNFRIPLTNIVSVVKPALYFLNAIQTHSSDDEQYFFASFNGKRDHCYARLHQLWSARLMREKMETVSQAQVSGQETLRKMSVKRRQSYQLSPMVTTLPPVVDRDSGEVQLPSTLLLPTELTTEDFEEDLPLPDATVASMTSILDMELPSGVGTVFDQLWAENTSFYRDSVIATKDIDVVITKWQRIDKKEEESTSKGFVISTESFDYYREIEAKHPPKVNFPGLPKFAKLHRMQRYRSEGKKMHDRLVISDLQSLFDIPYSDYFQIETRWVFTRDGKNNCHVEVGLQLNFSKSTWFKVQIVSSTISESKECMEIWGKMALERITSQGLTEPLQPPATKTLSSETLSSETQKSIPTSTNITESNDQEIACPTPITTTTSTTPSVLSSSYQKNDNEKWDYYRPFYIVVMLCCILMYIIFETKSALRRIELDLAQVVNMVKENTCSNDI